MDLSIESSWISLPVRPAIVLVNYAQNTKLNVNYISYNGTDCEVNEQFLAISVTYSLFEVLIRTIVSAKIRTIKLYLACMLNVRVISAVRSVPSCLRYQYNLIHWLQELITDIEIIKYRTFICSHKFQMYTCATCRTPYMS